MLVFIDYRRYNRWTLIMHKPVTLAVFSCMFSVLGYLMCEFVLSPEGKTIGDCFMLFGFCLYLYFISGSVCVDKRTFTCMRTSIFSRDVYFDLKAIRYIEHSDKSMGKIHLLGKEKNVIMVVDRYYTNFNCFIELLKEVGLLD